MSRLALGRTDVAAAAVGAAATLVAVYGVEVVGLDLGIGLLVGACLLLGIVAAFVAVPHVAVAVAIAYFAVLPALRVFVHDLLGGTKDLIVLAAVLAAGILFVERRSGRIGWNVDRVVLVLIAFLATLYAANVGGLLSGESGYGAAWFHGLRLLFEPLALLVVGMSLRDPGRTFRWGATALVVTSVAVALVGLAQQLVGVQTLLDVGYTYGAEVRQIGSRVRSFGTLPEPFSYAALLLLAATVVLLGGRMRRASYAVAAILALGLTASLVRTAALVALAVVGLALARRGHLRLAVVVILATAVGAAALFVAALDAPSTRNVRISPSEYLTLNGRTSVWRDALGDDPSAWALGRGVGAVGTAAQRATESLTGTRQVGSSREAILVDSAYLAIASDVGLLGIVLFLALLTRLLHLAWRAAAYGVASGWIALGLLTVLALDALTRESVTGFPTAYVTMLLVGLATATWGRDVRATAPQRDAAPGRAPAVAPAPA